jgi:undecaprenyl-diphosphatase
MLDDVDHVIAVVANSALFVVAAGALLVWLRAPLRDKIPFALAGILAALFVAVAVKAAGLLWDDPRPFVVDGTTPLIPHGTDNGFPSDHTTLAMAVAVVVLLRHRVAGSILVGIALLLGGSRVAAHVHHWPDILAGLGVGTLCGLVGVALAARFGPALTARFLPQAAGTTVE